VRTQTTAPLLRMHRRKARTLMLNAPKQRKRLEMLASKLKKLKKSASRQIRNLMMPALKLKTTLTKERDLKKKHLRMPSVNWMQRRGRQSVFVLKLKERRRRKLPEMPLMLFSTKPESRQKTKRMLMPSTLFKTQRLKSSASTMSKRKELIADALLRTLQSSKRPRLNLLKIRRKLKKPLQRQPTKE